MKTIIIHEGQKNTIQGECKPREAMEILGLNPTQWKVTTKDITDKAATYTIERKHLTLEPVVPTEEPEEERVVHFESIGSESTIDLSSQTKTAPPETLIRTITISRGELQEVLAVIADVVQKNALMPILTTAKLVSTPEGLTLSATDLEQSFSVTIPCEGEPIALCVDAGLLFREVKALHKEIDEVVLTATAETISINDRCTLPVVEIDDFPELVTVEGTSVSVESLAPALCCVLPAVSEDQMRYTLTGVFFDFRKGKVIGTDGFRLHIADIEPADVAPVILPRRSAILLHKYQAKDLTLSEKHLAASLMGGVFTARIMEGTFPDYEHIMPDVSSHNKASFIASEFIELMPGVLPVSEKAIIDITINGRIDIETQSASGSYKWYVPADTTLENTSKKIRLNCRYLVDAIKAYACDDNVILCFPDEYGAITINGKALIMPMKY